MSDSIRRNLALFPIGIVQKLTDLTARQIRYYEQHRLIEPARTDGNQRLFSFNDVERLLEIKRFLEQGMTITGIKKMLGDVKEPTKAIDETFARNPELNEQKAEKTERELHELLSKEIMFRSGRHGKHDPLIAGQLSRFKTK